MDDQKNKILIPLLVFSLIVMGYQLAFNTFGDEEFSYLKVLIAFVLGGVAAGGTFVAMGGMKK